MRSRSTTLSRVIPLRELATMYAVSRATLAKWRATDPAFPELIQVGTNRYGVRESDAITYQTALAARAAKRAREVPANLRDPHAAAARSVEVRRAKAAARRAEQGTVS
jgi:hypothetical protein